MENLTKLALLFSLFAFSLSSFNEKRLFLIDYNKEEQTYLFRGNEPVDNGLF